MSSLELPVQLHNEASGVLALADDVLQVMQLNASGLPPKVLISCPPRLVLRARLAHHAEGRARRLELFTLGQKSPTSTMLNLRQVHVLVDPEQAAQADAWVNTLMQRAYPVTKPFRRVLLLVNPVGGKGKARSIVKEQIMPILEAAGCKVEVVETLHSKHAEEICAAADLSQYDAIASASGDGNMYEIFNGLAGRPDGKRALRIPIAPIPTGSACAASTNIFGVKDTFNYAVSALNIVKGQPQPIDLCSILMLPSGERRLAFLSIATGLMTDLDIGTEHLRWMGDARFIYGFVRGLTHNRVRKARLLLDVVSDDKDEMAQAAQAAAKREGGLVLPGEGTDPLQLIKTIQTLRDNGEGPVDDSAKEVEDNLDDGPLPPQVPLQPTADWVVIESGTKKRHSHKLKRRKSKTNSMMSSQSSLGQSSSVGAPSTLSSDGSPVASPNGVTAPQMDGNWKNGDGMLYIYAGLMPWVSRDLSQWPVAMSGSGVIDMVIQRVASRTKLLVSLPSATYGDTFWDDTVHYYKVRAFVAQNLDQESDPFMSVDGEGFKWDTIHVEVLPRAGTILSLDGRFFHTRFVHKDHDRGK